MKSRLELKGMKFHANHGCLPFEKESGGEYLVDFECCLDFSKAAETDCLSDTIDLARIHTLVAEQMAVPSKLIESVASRIADAVAREYPKLRHFSVKVCKLNPPVDGECLMSSATIEI